MKKMKKKLICLALVLVAVLFGCEPTDQSKNNDEKVNSESLNAKVNDVNSKDKIAGEYMLEMTFGEGVTLYYALGEMAWDREAQTAFTDFSYSYLGVSGKTENYFKNGKLTSVDGGEVITGDRKAEELFSKIPYSSMPLYSGDCKGLVVSDTSSGTAYSFTRSDTKKLSKMFVEDDIYDIVTVLKKPQPEKTQYSDMQCVYTVNDGKLVSCRFEFDMKLFDTPAYVPGYSVPEEDYTIDIHVNAKITYKQFGNDVSVEEYSETVSE